MVAETRIISGAEAGAIRANEDYERLNDLILYRRLGGTRRTRSQEGFAELEKSNKYVWNVGGWRSGKSVEVCVQGVMAALGYPGSFGLISRQVEAAIEDSIMKTWFAVCPAEVIDRFNSTKRHLYLTNGSEVIFRGFDKIAYLSKLRSVELDWFIICQAEEISLEDFRLLQSRLNGRRGPLKGWLEGNPPPSSHWLWKEFVDDPKPGFAYVQSPTLENRENLPEDYVGDLLAVGDEEWIRRYVYGERVAFRGLVFPQFDRERHTCRGEDLPLDQVERWILCKDWGWSRPGVSLVVGVTGEGQWLVVREVYLTETQISSPSSEEDDWLGIDRALVEEYGIGEGYADPSRPDAIALYNEGDENHESVLQMEPGGNDVQAGVGMIRGLLSKETKSGRGLMISRACPHLIRETEGYKYRSAAGELLEVPLKRDDHGIDALKAALLALGTEKADEGDWIGEWEEAPHRKTVEEWVAEGAKRFG